MTQFIVLSLAEVDKLFPVDPKTGSRQKVTSPGQALDPIALEDGVSFILPLEILTDPKHEQALDTYKADPKIAIDLKSPVLQRDIAPQEFKSVSADAVQTDGALGEEKL